MNELPAWARDPKKSLAGVAAGQTNEWYNRNSIPVKWKLETSW